MVTEDIVSANLSKTLALFESAQVGALLYPDAGEAPTHAQAIPTVAMVAGQAEAYCDEEDVRVFVLAEVSQSGYGIHRMFQVCPRMYWVGMSLNQLTNQVDDRTLDELIRKSFTHDGHDENCHLAVCFTGSEEFLGEAKDIASLIALGQANIVFLSERLMTSDTLVLPHGDDVVAYAIPSFLAE